MARAAETFAATEELDYVVFADSAGHLPPLNGKGGDVYRRHSLERAATFTVAIRRSEFAAAAASVAFPARSAAIASRGTDVPRALAPQDSIDIPHAVGQWAYPYPKPRNGFAEFLNGPGLY